MAIEPKATQYTIGIIGGGKVGLDLFMQFSDSDTTQVLYVVDINPDAPAILAAKKAGVPTFKEIDQALSVVTSFILEVTGSEKVLEILSQKLSNSATRLITHEMAFVILRVIQENEQKARTSVVQEIGEIKAEIDKSLDAIDNLVSGIDNISSEMQMLSLNARIEAARAGEAGKGFGVVAEHMGQSVNSVVEIARQISQVSNAIQSTSSRIEKSVEKLI